MHIIFYVLDALRYDHLGCYGYSRSVSPNIDALAQDGVVFENCFTATTWTRPVAASILTGVYPTVHKTQSRNDMFLTPMPRLPELLKSVGFKTAAFCTMGNIAGEIGFNRGFDEYYDLFRDPNILAKRRRLDSIDEALMHNINDDVALPLAEDIHEKLFPWLKNNRAENTFSFVWSIETHVPYEAPPSFRRYSQKSTDQNQGNRDDIRQAGAKDVLRLIDLYDDEIFYNDFCIGQIINHLETLGIYDDTLFIMVGDHGEAFYEHGVYTHGHAPYEEVIHVPLLMKFPNNQHANKRFLAITELIDIFPTVMDLVEASTSEVDDLLQGQSLLPIIHGTKDNVREFAFSDTQTLEVHNRYVSIRGKRWKYIQLYRPKRDTGTILSTIQHIIERRLILKILRSPRHFLRNYFKRADVFLFDLDNDPGEKINLAAQHPEKVARFKELIIEWHDKNEELASKVGEVKESYQESDTLRQHLEKLGYL